MIKMRSNAMHIQVKLKISSLSNFKKRNKEMGGSEY
jgi:hypothetical protein